MELHHLRYFVAVAEHLSFTRAAASLHVTQPSLTRQIRNLEEEIGARLFSRGNNHVALTPEGLMFLNHAKEVLAKADEGVQAVRRLSRIEKSVLNIGYSVSLRFELLSDSLAALRKHDPRIVLRLFDMTPAEQFRALEMRRIDLGFVGQCIPPASDDLAWERLMRQTVVVALPENHPMAARSSLALADLKPLFFISLSETTHPGYNQWLSKVCSAAGFVPKVVHRADIESGIAGLVAGGLGVALVRQQTQASASAGVVLRPLKTAIVVDSIIAWNRVSESELVLRFIRLIRERAAKLG